MTLQQAIDAPRMSVTGAGSGRARWNPASRRPRSTRWRALGYTVTPADVGSVQAVLIDRRPASSTALPTRAAKAR